MGASSIRQGLPTRQQQHDDGVIMTGASFESAANATDRAAITADLKKKAGRKKPRTDDGKVRFALARGGGIFYIDRRCNFSSCTFVPFDSSST